MELTFKVAGEAVALDLVPTLEFDSVSFFFSWWLVRDGRESFALPCDGKL